ncbi:ead/Ea22-like family protein [Citrobacter meridianamericanus]|uniref:ead/Ea22-like family protein n=1 Tax=Citrobacter meridianamericanus TaxID=2894201 RepID=UPI0039798825
MTALNKQALRQLAEKATHGEWWSDVVETDGEYGDGEDRASGYHSYAVYVGNESLLDMTNSTAACIHEEWDHDYHMAWDETGKRNAEFIAAANPATVLELLDELEAAEKRIAEHNFENRLLANADRDIKALRQRIAELEARTVTLPPTFWYEHDDLSSDIPVLDKRLVKKAIRAAGIGVKGE